MSKTKKKRRTVNIYTKNPSREELDRYFSNQVRKLKRKSSPRKKSDWQIRKEMSQDSLEHEERSYQELKAKMDPDPDPEPPKPPQAVIVLRKPSKRDKNQESD